MNNHLLFGWSKHVTAMDPEALLVVEEMSYEHRAGGRASERDMVRWPRPPVAAPAPVV